MCETKICSSCKKDKPINQFSNHTKSIDGKSSNCLVCMKSKEKELKVGKKRKKKYKQPIKRKCACCKVKFPIGEFSKRGIQSNGHIKYGSYCKQCVSDKNNTWRQTNPETYKECMTAGWKKYRDENPDRYSAQRAKHRAVKIKATPIWFDEGKEAVVKMYAESIKKTKETGIMHHVDHIVPLNSKKVCGLHCVDNLQVLTAKENLIKSNLVWPDMW